jgi:hypothetical protein
VQKGAVGQQGLCPFGPSARVDFYIYGGTPPYTIASPLPNVLTVLQSTVSASGGGFTAQVQDCGTSSLLVTDSRGLVIQTAQLAGVRGPNGDAAPATSLSVSPTVVSLGCNSSVSVALAGSGAYTVSLVQSAVAPNFTVSRTSGTLPGDSTVTFTRTSSGTVATGAATPAITANFNSGSSVVPVTINLAGGTIVGGSHTCP